MPLLAIGLTVQLVVHTHDMVCGTHSMATHRGQSLLALGVAILHANTDFPGGTPISPFRLVSCVDGRIR